MIMKQGDLVRFKIHGELVGYIGIIVEPVTGSERLYDPFPQWFVFFNGAIVRCRESDLGVIM